MQLQLQLPGAAPETAAGQVFAYDAATDRLVLRTPGSTPFHSCLRIVRGEHVTGLSFSREDEPPPEALPAVDLARCREREDKAVRAAEAEAAKIGVGVSRQAQVRRAPALGGCRRASWEAGSRGRPGLGRPARLARRRCLRAAPPGCPLSSLPPLPPCTHNPPTHLPLAPPGHL